VLPTEADPPEIAKANAGGEAVAILNFSSDSMSLLEISDYAERYIVDRIATVPGVARASLSGARRYAMRIWLDRQALAARRMTVADIEGALRRENVQLPAGRLESTTREFSLRTEVGLDTEQDFRDLVIGRGDDGHLVRLGEVAGVQLAAENERTIARTNGQPGVGVFVEAQSKANTLEVVRGVRKEVEILQAKCQRAHRCTSTSTTHCRSKLRSTK
jgi:multidrug efflux pump